MNARRVPPTHMENDRLAALCDVRTVSFERPIPPNTWCHYCGFLAGARDHIVPDSVGGRDAWWNLVPSCEPCNNEKATRQTCSCLFCVRAMALWSFGYRRAGMTRGERKRQKKQRDREAAITLGAT